MIEYFFYFVDFILHLDKHLNIIIQNYGVWTYAILFLIVFFETAFVITPFLPGDSLLFAAGAFAATGSLKLATAVLIFSIAAISGDTINYHIGYYVGPKVFRKENVVLLNKKHLERTQLFYQKHGGKTIILARFIPIIRTFAPFVAGIGKMGYWKFISYNIIGGIVWVLLFSLAGYFFGTIPVVKENFTFVILAIIVISLLPVAKEVIAHFRAKKQEQSALHKHTK